MNNVESIVELFENYKDTLPRIVLDNTVEDAKRIAFFPGVDDCLFCFQKITDEVNKTRLISY